MKVAIIGAGASGLVASIFSARNGNEVYVFEKNNDAGKKLLLTGNGRCNFSNVDHNLNHYHSSNGDLIKEIINDNNIEKVMDFFKNIGVVSKNKNGYLYPFSEKSSSIKSALVNEAKSVGVNFLFNSEVNEIKTTGDGFLINNGFFDKVVVATGSYSLPKTGSDGFGYGIAESFNHTINEVNPSLVQLVSNISILNDWAGKRCEVNVIHCENEKLVKEEKGEIQLTNYGLSGICIFNLSRDIRIGLNKCLEEGVIINFVPWLEGNIMDFLTKRNNDLKTRNITELCDGFMDYSLVFAILKYLKINPNKNWNELNLEEKESFSSSLRAFYVPIIDTKGFVESQTCSGGIPLSEINLKTMESLKQKGLFFTGELLDLDGDCGGYNLTIAWITGMLAGEDHD